MRDRVREVSTGTFVRSGQRAAQKHKGILHLCYCLAVTHMADVSPSEHISSCARPSATRVRIQDPGCKHGAAALQMWQGTAELCPEHSGLEGDAIKALPLNPLAVLAQRSEQVHTRGGGGMRYCVSNMEGAKMTMVRRHSEHPLSDFGQLLREQACKPLNS